MLTAPVARVPAAGSLEALFAAPPEAANLRQVHDPDTLWGIIDEILAVRRVHDAVECGVYRGTSVALAATQVGFLDGQGAADHEGLVDSFEDTAKAVVAEPVCLVEKNGVKSYCTTFCCYLVKFVQSWIN
jgi:hypothetical protein